VGILGVQQRKHLERIKVSTERMGRLVDDLIQIASLEGNVSKLTLEEVDLGKVIQDAVGETKRQIMQKDIQLRLDLPEAPLHLSTDLRALRKVFSSLLNNAVQVTSPGGNVRLLARKESTDGEEDYVLVQVIDSGGGIALTDLPMIFSHRSPDAPIQGIGNGGVDLPGTKTLIEVMGGRTWVDSEPGQGAVFSVLLPIAPFVDGGAE
jgi:signal transduction histidine kinase